MLQLVGLPTVVGDLLREQFVNQVARHMFQDAAVASQLQSWKAQETNIVMRLRVHASTLRLVNLAPSPGEPAHMPARLARCTTKLRNSVIASCGIAQVELALILWFHGILGLAKNVARSPTNLNTSCPTHHVWRHFSATQKRQKAYDDVRVCVAVMLGIPFSMA